MINLFNDLEFYLCKKMCWEGIIEIVTGGVKVIY